MPGLAAFLESGDHSCLKPFLAAVLQKKFFGSV